MLESGEVQRWFAANGWKYPVAGVPARGIGAVQQFFECLGLSKPPPLALSDTELAFHVTAPQVLRGQVSLRTETKKWVYAQVDSGVPWLRMTTPSVSGPQHAMITFDIDSGLMDGRPQQDTLIRLIANGGQRLAVRVRVNVQYPRGYAAPRRLLNGRSLTVAVLKFRRCRWQRLWRCLKPRRPVRRRWRGCRLPRPRRRSIGCRRQWRSRDVSRPALIVCFGRSSPGLSWRSVFRLVLAGPAEVLARVVLSKTTSPPPGSLQCWKHSPLERLADGTTREEHFLKWFVISTWWLGGVAGAWLAASAAADRLIFSSARLPAHWRAARGCNGGLRHGRGRCGAAHGARRSDRKRREPACRGGHSPVVPRGRPLLDGDGGRRRLSPVRWAVRAGVCSTSSPRR